MNSLFHVDEVKEKQAFTGVHPVKVCMHVQSIARIDPRVMREASTLVKAGFSVAVVDIEGDAGRPGTEEMEGVWLRHVRMAGWYDSTPFPWSLFKAGLMFTRTLLRLLGTPADMYHAHDAPALPATYIVAWLRRKPLIFDAHELPLSELPVAKMSKSRAAVHPLLTRLFAKMLPRCAGVIATSEPMAHEISNSYCRGEVAVVRNVPFYQQAARTDRLRRRLGLTDDVRIALYQGNIQADRELERVVRAARFLDERIVIVMMGKADEITLAQLETLIAGEGVGERVKIIPPVSYGELLDWTVSADIGLSIFSPDYSPHMRVCLPNKLFEYLMAGLPVLASELEAVADVVKTYGVGQILTSLEPAEIGAAMNTMFADPVALNRMRGNALLAAKSEFFWEKERLQLVRLYKRVLALPEVVHTGNVVAREDADSEPMPEETTI